MQQVVQKNLAGTVFIDDLKFFCLIVPVRAEGATQSFFDRLSRRQKFDFQLHVQRRSDPRVHNVMGSLPQEFILGFSSA
jgi:hypothetical protein